jgi:mannose-6-phosphate isomerase
MDNRTHPPTDDIAGCSVALNRWLNEAALPLWWEEGADHVSGGFHELLDLDGRPLPVARRARVQARQVFVYAHAAAAGWEGPGHAAAEHGIRYFRSRYRRSDGLFRRLVGADGHTLDDSVTLYDQAFALLAMASLHAINGDISLCDDSQTLFDVMAATMRHEAGGFRETAENVFQSNPHMHLLEAALAWAEAGGGAVWERLADEIVELCLSHFIDREGGFLREYFGPDWTPAPGDAGRIVEPGHQFEWAWLLERWGKRRGFEAAQRVADSLFVAGSYGVDARGIAVDEMDDSLSIRSGRARLWPQTERLKAAMLLRERADGETRIALERHALDAAKALARYLEMPTKGLWRDKLHPNGEFTIEPAPASSFYHIVCAVEALQEQTPQA